MAYLPIAETIYLNLIITTREMHPGMGLRTIYELHLPRGIGRDAFMQIGAGAGLQLGRRQNAVRTTYSTKSRRYRNLLDGKTFTDVNQLWSSDITYFQAGGVTYYIAFVMDVYSRRIIGKSVETHMRAESMHAALQEAFALRKVTDFGGQLIHHSDRGTQYASNLYTDALDARTVLISMCQEVYENTHIERVNGTIKNQYLEYWIDEIRDITTMKRYLNRAVEAYNTSRPHQSLGNISPIQYETILPTIPPEQRTKLKIYTVKMPDTNVTNTPISQLKLEF